MKIWNIVTYVLATLNSFVIILWICEPRVNGTTTADKCYPAMTAWHAGKIYERIFPRDFTLRIALRTAIRWTAARHDEVALYVARLIFQRVIDHRDENRAIEKQDGGTTSELQLRTPKFHLPKSPNKHSEKCLNTSYKCQSIGKFCKFNLCPACFPQFPSVNSNSSIFW